MEKFNLAQLTKEMVVSQIRNTTDPTLVAAEVVRGTLIARLQDHNKPDDAVQEAVIETCRGAMIGMLLSDCPLDRGAAALLVVVESAAKTANLDPEMVQVAALRGIADSRRFVKEEVLAQIRARLKSARPGSERIFDRFCADLHSHQSHPHYIPPRM